MWHQVEHATADQWSAALLREGNLFGNGTISAAANVICAVRKFHEIFVGGDDTACLLQIIGGSDDEGKADIIASVLIPTEQVQVVHTERGPAALQLLCSFWKWSPASPALLQHHGAYLRLMCRIDDEEWSEGPLTPTHIAKLQSSNPRSNCDALQVFVPGEPHEAVRPRAAICRPKEVYDSELHEHPPRDFGLS